MHDPFDVAAVERVCSALVAAFAVAIDHGAVTQAVALFSEGGVFSRPDTIATGHAELTALWSARPANVVTRHLCGPPFFTDVAAESARATTYFALHRVDGSSSSAEATSPAVIGEYHDRFMRCGDGWKIAHRQVVVAFAR